MQNLNSSTDYTGKVSFFKCSAAHDKIIRFLTTLNREVQGRTLRELRGETGKTDDSYGRRKITLFASDAAAEKLADNDESKEQATAAPAQTSAGILAIQTLLNEIDALVERCPPEDKNASVAPPLAAPTDASAAPASSGAPARPAGGSAIPLSSRFGSGSFRTFLTLLDHESDRLLDVVLSSATGPLPDPDVEPSAQSVAWEREGFETLRKFKEENSKHGAHDHAHHHHAHKLPPGVVISHGPTGVGNPPAQTKSESHEHNHDHAHDHDSSASPPAVAPLDASPSAKRARVLHHLKRYLLQSWGDIRRLDYGTGHEMNFMCFLYALGECGVFHVSDAAGTDPTDAHRLIGIVFAQYVKLMRKLQTTYWLEPAGSRGVWGLDDYSFLPFLFGSAQLIGHRHIKPKYET